MTNASDTKLGAWVISHSLKLQQVDTVGQYSKIEAAGKYGRVLSLLSASTEETIAASKLQALAKANGINPDLELGTLLDKLESVHVINRSRSGDISILGLTHRNVLEKTAEYFRSLNPAPEDKVVIAAAECVSEAPILSSLLNEFLSDKFALPKKHTEELLSQAEEIGFVDAEKLDSSSQLKLVFNGNIFRVKDAAKTYKILESLTDKEKANVSELSDMIAHGGYVTYDSATGIVGTQLFAKLQAIAFFDINKVANDKEEILYVTHPASFSKYGNPWEEDTLDYAKALVSSLAYGINRSPSHRGKIRFLHLLLEKLISGQWLNENTAAGQDYKYLEFKRVIETRPGVRVGCYNMRLLKREVGVIALQVLTRGSESSESLVTLPSATITRYAGPEKNRQQLRRKRSIPPSDRKMLDMLNSIRTGKI